MGRRLKRAFISHSWRDKSLARRIARRLAHRGVQVWLDDGALQAGDVLTDEIFSAIKESSHFIVLVSAAAKKSQWVMLEIVTAKSARCILVPVVSECEVSMGLMGDYLGLSLTDWNAFEKRMDELATAILGHEPKKERDLALLRADLEAVATEAPAQARWIHAFVEIGTITQEQFLSLSFQESERHEFETALIMLYELFEQDSTACLALGQICGRLYIQYGVGYCVALRHALLCDKAKLHNALINILVYINEQPCANSHSVDAILNIYEQVTMNLAPSLEVFARKNSDNLTEQQVNRIINLCVTSYRGPGSYNADLAFLLYQHRPDSEILKGLWERWIMNYNFLRRQESYDTTPAIFFILMNEAHVKGLHQFEELTDIFHEHFRYLIKSRPPHHLLEAIDVYTSAEATNYYRIDSLREEFERVIYSCELETDICFQFRVLVCEFIRTTDYGRRLQIKKELEAKLVDIEKIATD